MFMAFPSMPLSQVQTRRVGGRGGQSTDNDSRSFSLFLLKTYFAIGLLHLEASCATLRGVPHIAVGPGIRELCRLSKRER